MNQATDGELPRRVRGEKALLEAFEKEEAEERMFPLPFTELRNRYSGSALRVVAQADSET